LPEFVNFIGYPNIAIFVIAAGQLPAILLSVESCDNQKPGKYACSWRPTIRGEPRAVPQAVKTLNVISVDTLSGFSVFQALLRHRRDNHLWVL